MSLNGALQIGQSAIVASQTAIQVAGNNMANAATEGFHRQSTNLAALRGTSLARGQFIGRGVEVSGITREIDTALEGRLRDAMSQENASLVDQQYLTAIETLQNELSDNDLSSLLSDFFNGFSELANNPSDAAVRAIAIQTGQTLATRVTTLRGDYDTVRTEIDRALEAAVVEVNDLLDQIATMNSKIAMAEGGAGEAASLRDHRDQLLGRVSELMDITTIEQSGGVTDVLVGSLPVVLGSESRGVALERVPAGSGTELRLQVKSDGSYLNVQSGRLGGLMRQRTNTVQPAVDTLDRFASQLIFQVNRLHAQGQGGSGFASAQGIYGVQDATTNLNLASNDLPFRVENGSFFIHVTHKETGIKTAHQVNVDGDAMSLDDLVTQINTTVNVPNVTASVSVGSQLRLDADGGYEISFSDDSSGALAALGINTYFNGRNATDIAVDPGLMADPTRLSVGLGHVPGSNGSAVAIADLQGAALGDLGGQSLRSYWLDSVNDLAVRTSAANDAVESAQLVRESLGAQRQSVSGVSIDEEAINLITYQRQFQAAARFIQIIDEALETLLSIS